MLKIIKLIKFKKRFDQTKKFFGKIFNFFQLVKLTKTIPTVLIIFILLLTGIFSGWLAIREIFFQVNPALASITAISLAQYKNDGSTPIANGGWTKQSEVKIYATSTSDGVTIYYQVATTSGNFLTATTTPASACSSGTAWTSCPTRVWKSNKSTPADIPSLPDFDGYKWQALACGAGGCANSWTIFDAATPNFRVDTVAPSVPSGLSNTAASSTRLHLAWTASSDTMGVTGYKIYRGGSYLNSSSSNAFTDTGLSVNTQYSYTVSAFDAAGNISASSSAAAKYTLANIPSAPTVGGQTKTTLNVTINENSNPSVVTFAIKVNSQYVQANHLLGASVTSKTKASWGTPITVSGLSPGTSYSVSVKAINSNFVSTVYSAITTVTTLPTNLIIYRSVGPSQTNELASGTATALLTIDSAGNTSFSGTTIPDNVGVGDVILYDSDNNNSLTAADDIVFINGRNSNTSFSVQNESGGITATTTTGNDTWMIYRAYTSLHNASDASGNVINSSIPVGFDAFGGAKDLVTDSQAWNIACYADAPDTTAATMDYWTTGANNYLRVFTPYSSSEVGTTQRHNGKWTKSKYYIKTSASDNTINDYVSYSRLEGLQIIGTDNPSNSYNSGIAVSMEATGDVYISENIIRGGITSATSRGVELSDASSYGASFFAKNNLIYDFKTGIDGTANKYHAHLYNNTSVYNAINFDFYNTAQDFINNLSYGATEYDYETNDNSTSTNNSYALSAFGSNPVNLSSTASTGIFADPANDDFRLLATSPVIAQAVNLSGSTVYPFTNDIKNQTRSAWDVGADEYVSLVVPSSFDAVYKYAWGDKIGWINFGADGGGAGVSSYKLHGYVWAPNFGWISLAASSSGVMNDNEGNLSGLAWGENIGWINFNGVKINTTNGEFTGYATTTSLGTISFNCSNTDSCADSNFKVITNWRPAVSISFSVAPNNASFGNLDAGAARFASSTAGAAAETTAHTLSASSGSAGGYVITVQGATLSHGANSIAAVGASKASSTPGFEQFGLRLFTASGVGKVTPPYNGSAGSFAYAGTANTASQVASDITGGGTESIYSVRYLANISSATAATDYTTTLVYVATGNY
ncbi:MAG TPA: fibronectin type III domain-containing protein [Candidatus Methylomirabilis sp.]|nr:fibronectin type III domain-containing protein [Candidatus Methylomirabilis sp.]